MTRRTAILAAAAVAVSAGSGWWLWGGGEERAIRRRLGELRDLVNATAPEGLGTLAQAVEIGSFFTVDTVVDFGDGASPLHGRETVVAMATRLHPRTETFELELDDVSVSLTGETTADVRLTAIARQRTAAPDEESIDARDFALALSKTDGKWRIARATAIETPQR